MVLLKRAHFFASFHSQSFPFQNSMIYYITMNPSTPKLYRKLIQSCKHFFIKNPIIILSDVCYYNGDGNNFIVYENGVKKSIDYNNLSSKFWIINSFDAETIDSKDHPIEAVVSSIICKLYKCDIKDLRLRNQKLKYDDLKLLSSNVEDVVLNWVNVYRNGNVIPFEQIVEAFPRAKKIQYIVSAYLPRITSKTAKELIKIPQIQKLSLLTMRTLSEDFDIDTFYSFIKKNDTRISLCFSHTISEAFKNRLEAIIDKIIEAKNHAYIYFHGLEDTKNNKMWDLFNKRKNLKSKLH